MKNKPAYNKLRQQAKSSPCGELTVRRERHSCAGKSNIVFLMIIIGVMLTSLLSARDTSTFADEYLIRPGDRFLIQIIGLRTEEFVVPVTVTGKIILFPLTSPIDVSGYTLSDAQAKIISHLSEHITAGEIFAELISIQPYSIHVLGAVINPGEYITDTLTTLYQSLQLANGLSPAASKKITVVRNQETRVYDLNRYLRYGDLSQNPLIFGEDRIHVGFAEEFTKLYVVTDTVNYVEYFEMETEKRVSELMPLISIKYPYSNYDKIFMKRDGKLEQLTPHSFIRSGDILYLHPEESYIFVRGHVNSPGKFNFQANRSPQYFISMAGGITRVGSERRIRIVTKEGKQYRYRGQALQEGDTILVPLSTRTWVTDYLTPISTSLSLIATIVVLTR